MGEGRGRVLVIAGSDSGAGAGIQSDIKTIAMLGGYATTAITAITVQDTLGVHAVWPVPESVIEAQGRVVLADIGADAVKVGMIGGAVSAVARLIDAAAPAPAVIDPVMAAKDGSDLMGGSRTLETVRSELVPRAALLTPNAPEAAALAGVEVIDLDSLRRAAWRLLEAGAGAVLATGGHLPGPTVSDLLVTRGGEWVFEGPRLLSRHSHGTGCTLASACAVGLAFGLELSEAVQRARAYVVEAIRAAPGLGAGCGPLGHDWPLRRTGDGSSA